MIKETSEPESIYEYYGEDYYCEESANQEDNNFSDIGLTKSNSYCIIKDEEVEKLRNNLVLQVEEYTSLDRSQAILALLYFQWNLDKLKDCWFEDTEKNLELSGITQSQESKKILDKNKIEINNKICLVCYMEESDCEGGFFSLTCKHNFCVDCWVQYLKANVFDHRQVLFTKCQQKDCNLIVPESIFKKFLKDEESLENLKTGIRKNFTDYNSDVKWCPSPGCDAAVRCESKLNKEIDCICGFTFCFKCTKEGHRPCQCDMIQTWDKKNTSESENIKWISANTKQCPNCRKFIEKNQGCNHMTCNKNAGGCGHEFCWVCLKDWKSHTACNRFNAEEVEEKEKDKKKFKIEYERYIHFFNRYMNHSKALKLATRMRNAIEYPIHSLVNFKNIIMSELNFLREAVESVIKSRRLLKYSYVFGFYLKKKCKEGSLFEHIQSKLETNVDKLHELLENQSLSSILTLSDFEEFNEEFKNYRNRIIDLFTATNTFTGNFLIEIENKMLHIVDYKKIAEK
jgi:ariadne-1